MAAKREKALQSVQRHVQKGAFDKAVAELRRWLATEPGDAAGWVELGDVHMRAGAVGDSVKAYAQAASVYAGTGSYLQSVAVYRNKVLQVQPESVNARLRLAELYRHLGMMADALGEYRQVARLYEKRGKDENAREVLNHILKVDPADVPSRVRLAELCSRQDDARGAVAELTVAAEHLRRSGRIDEYLRVSERLLYHQPDNLPVLRDLIGQYINHGMPQRALMRLQRWLKDAPRDVGALELLGRTFDALSQPDKAAEVLKEIARLHNEAGRAVERDSAWRRALERKPGDAEAQRGLDQARQERESTVKLSAELGEVLLADDTAPTEERADTQPGPAPLDAAEEQRLLTETDVYLKYGLREKAREHLDRILAASPNSTAALARLRDLHRSAGEQKELAEVLVRLAQAVVDEDGGAAVGYLRAALAADSEHAAARAMLARLGADPEPAEQRADTEPDTLVDGLAAERRTRTEELSPDLIISEQVLDEAAGAEAKALEEAGFFVQQGLLEEARAVLEAALALLPSSEALLAKLADVDRLDGGEGAATTEAKRQESDRDILKEAHIGRSPKPSDNTMDEMDGEAHFDLGLAYREMGLYDEAIQEFMAALEADVRRSECHRMVGLCHRDQQRLAESVEWLKRGLRAQDLTQAAAAALSFELAEVYAAMNDSSEAATHYRRVQELDPDYPQLRDRLRSLGLSTEPAI